ncbi:polysaccharide deacetylase family protein [Colwellia sp. 12G3]|uniref:polysaccharide deacetylase family protein n=1 Tax=Colwellia sp. 12G3 TaxID=2058299 RepID=UPI0012FEE0AE|nr:polysaccharide deacetylase family protein [Colwellia sp. 12G3]
MLSSVINGVTALSGENKLSVLTYHRVGESYNQLCMDEYLFEQQLIWIKKYFNPIGLTEALALQKKGKLPRRSIVITIDDGYVDSFTTIFPLLKKHNLTATFFISTSGLEKGYLWDEHISLIIMTLSVDIEEFLFEGRTFEVSTYNERIKCAKEISDQIKYCSLNERETLIQKLVKQTKKIVLKHDFLNELQIKLLYKQGMEIGAHTVNHPILTYEKSDVAKREMLDSKEILEDIIGEQVKYLAYPNGKLGIDFDENNQNQAKECGFDAAFSSDWGFINHSPKDLYSLKRFTPWDKSEAKFCLRLALNFTGYYMKLDK